VTQLLGRLDAAAGGLLARLGRSPVLAVLLIALVAAVYLIPGQAALPLTDRDEARYVVASQQMLATGDFVEPRNLDEPRWKKPVGIYWLQSAAAALSGQGAEAPLWVWRLPSALGILAAALLTLWAVRPLVGPGAAAVAGLAVAAAAVTAAEGNIAKTDAALLATIVLAQGALVRALDRAPELGFAWPHALLWTALAAGVLIKGPIILLVTGGTLLWLALFELSSDPFRRTKPWPGLLLFAILTLPWFVAIGIATDWGFYAESLGRDFLGKVDGAAEGHAGPPGYYLATVWITFWPWAPLALLAIPFAWAGRRTEAVRFLAGWILPTWAVFEIATTKLPHYVMPVLPAVGALIGLWLVANAPRGPVLRWTAAALSLLGALVIAAATVGAPVWFEGAPVWSAVALALLGLVPAALGALALGRGLPRAAALLGVVAGALLVPALLREALPRLDSLFLSPRMAALDARFDACAPFPLATTGYRELSLAFYAGLDTRLLDAAGAEALLADPAPGARVFLPLEEAERLAGQTGRPLHLLGTVEGINYNAGPEPIVMGLFALTDDPVLAPCRIP
jgi:4-amino-4-deoxy-L-arabinose transferase-like glycosyltransferase